MGHRLFAPMDIMTITRMLARRMAITDRNGSSMVSLLEWARGITGIGTMAGMVAVSMGAAGAATGTEMTGAGADSVGVAGIMTVFEAADSTMKALAARASGAAAASMVVVGSTVMVTAAVDFTEVEVVPMAAEAGTEVAMAGTGNLPGFST